MTTMTIHTGTPATQSAPKTRGVRRVRAKAVGVAVAASTALYLAASAAGVDFLIIDPGSKQEAHHLIVLEIAAFSLVFALLGWGSLAPLERVTRHARAVWGALAGAVLALSFVLIGIEQATASTRAVLAVIHIVVAVALLPLLRRPSTR